MTAARSQHQQMRDAINDVELALNGLEIDTLAREWEGADDSVKVKIPLGELRQLARCFPELNRIINDPAFVPTPPSRPVSGEPVAWRYKCQDGSEVLMLRPLTDEQKRRGYYTGEDGEDEVDGDEAVIGPFHWTEETPLYATPPAAAGREEIAQALFDRYCQRARARGQSPHHAPGTSVAGMPPSYRDDYLADADAVLALTPQDGRAAAEADFVIWVDTWVSHPVTAYSVSALDGLFGITRDKIARIRALAPKGAA